MRNYEYNQSAQYKKRRLSKQRLRLVKAIVDEFGVDAVHSLLAHWPARSRAYYISKLNWCEEVDVLVA